MNRLSRKIFKSLGKENQKQWSFSKQKKELIQKRWQLTINQSQFLIQFNTKNKALSLVPKLLNLPYKISKKLIIKSNFFIVEI